MGYNQTVTGILRQDRYTTSGTDLRNRMVRDFGQTEGRAGLARTLGVSLSIASRILAGRSEPNMHRLAFHYGFMPDETPTGWRVLPMREEPFSAGPRFRWHPRLMDYLTQVLTSKGEKPLVRVLAWRMDTTERRLRRAMRRYDIGARQR